MKFRKKPVVIEAVEVNLALHQAKRAWHRLPEWLSAAHEKGEVVFAFEAIYIETPEGEMRGNKGDWIIRGIEGEIYPCKPDIFEATYEAVE